MFSLQEVDEHCTHSGNLAQHGFLRWKDRYATLYCPPSGARELRLYESANSGNLKLRSSFPLEMGAIVRLLPPDTVGGRQNCFQVVASKKEVKFQARDPAECQRWACEIDAQFALGICACTCQSHLITSKHSRSPARRYAASHM